MEEFFGLKDYCKPKGMVSRWAFIDNQEPHTELWLTPEDVKKLGGRGRGLRGIAKDHKSGKTYRIYGASCGIANCLCAWRTKDAMVNE